MNTSVKKAILLVIRNILKSKGEQKDEFVKESYKRNCECIM